MNDTTRRTLLQALAAAPFLSLLSPAAQAEALTLKISHQFPGGTVDSGDFRDRLCRLFAAEVQKRSNGGMKFEIYPGSSLMKTNAQFSAMRKGALDLSLVPLSYAGGEVPEVNIGLMPGLVPSYEIGAAWKTAEVGKELNRILLEKGIVIVSWIWQAGGVASRSKAVIDPEDVKGMKIRGGSREVDLVLKAAGAAVVSLPSNEIYAAMQTGAMEAAMTSSTSLISFRLEEVSKFLTSGRGQSYWYMFEPLMMSKAIFDKLSREQQSLIMTVGAELEQFAIKAAKQDDLAVATVYEKKGAKVVDLSPASVKKWQAIARTTAWKDYSDRNESCAKLMKLAEKLL
ncbi:MULTISPECIES: TRAP transporter substrate-binding protein DctP [unclassified Undibacterium]|uniref:TRAP transporter substrate-binding protein n=1 Tax=unclassified Undibacterium TaxID=2630295 RepID=UPI002AC94531|nr:MULTISPECIES: TRAP transporter substrate-binding protein DctP [unclassified Undibacterium]MEB0137449.1 TRAP transporter substrate-binding protein DctP [Undibacterium sp. CCC2.1]MEB0170886.1 TRAP transporter substrate-binding protein DctP [Undibacterium sp. CCC1.1]MEB0174838.1 TRAP transporter substrate-binding protein DctP [Undibacterium sp. CCC3.4]MEB0214174.1 TRAP transporter substrate-binding protein DctP [Undibacterium sp. 5I2]WPX44486.1 TRAP transporter substrate-binding protein DctP [